jgi:hypothetical protein
LPVRLDGVDLPAVTGDAPSSAQVLDDMVGVGTYEGPFDPSVLTALGSPARSAASAA